MHSYFCCFYLHLTLLSLSIYSVPTACSYLLFCTAAIYRRMLGEKTEGHVFQISKPIGCVSALTSFLLKWLLDTSSPSSLNQTESRLVCQPSSQLVTLLLVNLFLLLKNESFTSGNRVVHVPKSVPTKPLSHYLCFFLVLPSGQLLSSPDPLALVLYKG